MQDALPIYIGREPRDEVVLDGLEVVGSGMVAGRDENLVSSLGASLRASQIAGALDAVRTMSIEYANIRVQFGRPIGKFQAVQQRSEEHTSELQSLMRRSYAVFCLKK